MLLTMRFDPAFAFAASIRPLHWRAVNKIEKQRFFKCGAGCDISPSDLRRRGLVAKNGTDLIVLLHQSARDRSVGGCLSGIVLEELPMRIRRLPSVPALAALWSDDIELPREFMPFL